MSLSEELIEKMENFVRVEAQAQQVFFQRLWETPLAERVGEGRCLDELEFESEESGGRLKFKCHRPNTSEFREGDLVRLSAGEPMLSVFDADIYRVEEEAVWLSPDVSWKKHLPQLASGRWVLDRSYLDLSAQMLGAISQLGKTTRGREIILPLLTAEKNPTLDLNTASQVESALDEENDAQVEAIASGVATNLCQLIQGPPGTGKTYVLAAITRECVQRGESILICGPTHRSIHNALNAIVKYAPEITDIVKIGRPVYDPELLVEQYPAFRDSPLDGRDGPYVVGATAYTARSSRLLAEFDTIIFDEASQITLPLAVMGMLSGDRYIFLGDNKQLPPVVQSARPLEAADASIFHQLQGRGYTIMLNETYRLNAELTKWPSDNFYNGILKAVPDNAQRRLALPNPLADFHEVLDPEHSLVFLEMDHRNAYRQSDDEATTVVAILEHLHRAGLDLKNVAVVVPFRRQARRIRYFLSRRETLAAHTWKDCVIDTVERMQGQEREVILVSMTASVPEYLVQMVEFLLLPQRLNVAVTRGRSKVILLASQEIQNLHTGDPATEELVKLWKSLRAAAKVIQL